MSDYLPPDGITFTIKVTHYYYDGPMLATYEDQDGKLWLGMALGEMPGRDWPVLMVAWDEFGPSTARADVDDMHVTKKMVDVGAEMRAATFAYLSDQSMKTGAETVYFPTPLGDDECPLGELWIEDQRIKLTPDPDFDRPLK